MTGAPANDSLSPLTPDQKAAHEFLAELRTRIAIQPLPYRDGLETAALASLDSLFDASREAIKSHPGCEHFARTVTDALNRDLRPTTARWSRGAEDGRLASRDGGDAFRAEPAVIRYRLAKLADDLHQMAYGSRFPDKEVFAEIHADELKTLMQPLPFGFHGAVCAGSASPAEIASREAGEVAARRRLEKASPEGAAYDPADGMDAFGLALSGGGIRSATFCLGVVQVLADKGLLGQVDFLSTVSGGGFTGAFLNRRLGAADQTTRLAGQVGGAQGPDPDPIRNVRRLAKYLTVEHLGQRWKMATSALAGLLLNWTGPLSLLAFVTVLYRLLDPPSLEPTIFHPAVFVTLGVICGFALAGYGLSLRRRSRHARGFGSGFGFAALVLTTLGLAWGLRTLHPIAVALAASAALKWSSISFGAIVAAIPTLLRFLPLAQAPATRARILKVVLMLAAIVVPVALLFVFHALLRLDAPPAWRPFGFPAPWALAVALASGFVAWFGLNINLTGPHRLYRDAIAETFVCSEGKADAFVELTKAGGGRAPYHIVNAAVNLPAEDAPALRGRKCDFFAFTQHYCGSPSTGYARTESWRADGRPLDLATAVAISGAAVAPNMGLLSYPTLRAMLTLLNARLSFWLWRPGAKGRGLHAPGFLCLIREMTGWGMNTKSPWLCLSDGGHIENLGLYELLRRRCKFIVCVDAEQDGDFRFDAFAAVMRQAQIDFGLRLHTDLSELRPNPKTGLSRAHYAFARIDYPGTEIPGFLVYLKPSLTGDEDEMLKRFKIAQPEFPHHSTLDQFFDEECFEMYRRLGAHVATGLFGRALMRSRPDPLTAADWFSRLAVSLLEPKAPA